MISGLIESAAIQFNTGGPFMWVILFIFAVAMAVVLERIIYYYFYCRIDVGQKVSLLAKAINEGKNEEAEKIFDTKRAPVIMLLKVAFERYDAGLDYDDIQQAVEESAVKELPKLSNRLNYLSLFANVSTLLGLLGTISGLQLSFSALANVDATQKAELLATGISQAMNTTAFGLIVAVPCMIFFTILSNKQQALIKDLDEGLLKFLNFLRKKKGVN